MSGMKLWQKIVIVIGFVGAVVLLGRLILKDDGIKIKSKELMVDVSSGDLFEYSLKKNKGSMIPAKNPDTGEYALFPVYRDDDGDYYIVGRYMSGMRDLDVEPTAIDPSTYRVTVSDSKVKKIR